MITTEQELRDYCQYLSQGTGLQIRFRSHLDSGCLGYPQYECYREYPPVFDKKGRIVGGDFTRSVGTFVMSADKTRYEFQSIDMDTFLSHLSSITTILTRLNDFGLTEVSYFELLSSSLIIRQTNYFNYDSYNIILLNDHVPTGQGAGLYFTPQQDIRIIRIGSEIKWTADQLITLKNFIEYWRTTHGN